LAMPLLLVELAPHPGGPLLNYYRQFPNALDELARRIGYRVLPSWVWSYEEGGYPGLIIGFVNDGVAGVPGVLRISLLSEDGKVNVGGWLDPGRVRQAKFARPNSSGIKPPANIRSEEHTSELQSQSNIVC